MKSAVVIFFDESGAPVGCNVACETDQEEKQLQETERAMMQAIMRRELQKQWVSSG